MVLLGRAALIVALGLVAYAAIAGGLAAYRGRRRLADSARNALVGALAATVIASLVLLGALAAKDFSLVYVADHTSDELPLPYTLAAFWSGQEGSLLLWLLVLLAMSVSAVSLNARLTRHVLPWTVPVLAGVATFFAILLVFVASPFTTQSRPADGLGLNPSLQNPYMLAHPPLLYLGYVGLTIPFAFAMAALASRRTDERWIIATRRWTLAAWAFLGFAILLGAKWAYEEVGWGGWYAWDPVENAALMPWLVGTAFLHSVMVQEKKDMLRVWNAVLVALAFALALFGTFLTRSGILSSIHSFTQSSIGPWFLAFIAAVAAGSTALILVRLPLLRSRSRLESLVSREAAFLYNNLFLVAFALTVLWGVLYPILSEAVRGATLTVGPPYYDFFAIVFGLPIVLLMGIGPLVAWRRASLRSLGGSLVWPAAAAVLAGVVLLALGAGSSPVGLVGYTFAAFVLAAIALEFARGTRARRATGAATWLQAFTSLVARNRRRYGGYVVHAAIVLLLVGAVGIGGFSTKREARLRPGESVAVAGYTLTLLGADERRGANAQEIRARLAVERGGHELGTIEPGKNRYFAEEQTSNEVAIRSDFLRGEDLFVIADDFRRNAVFLEIIVNPLVNLIWLAGLVFLAGSVVALWPDAREQRRLARRFAEGEEALARA
ncbi:MAG: heme lyase CcmF/NrfE family subunit [Thermoleophilia bacterium]|nr:heme lyase CcmF/NrfE family subunit [Thermoleophilia bacterium]